MSALGLKEEHDETTKVFVGALFEVKKNFNRGTLGHIALKTDNIDYAIEYFRNNGVEVSDKVGINSSQHKERFVFLDIEIAGFTFQLVD